MEEGDHNCRLWGSISADFPDSFLFRNLVGYPNSLKQLAGWSNVDGWGIVSYADSGAIPRIDRGARRAYDDPFFDIAVWSIDTIPTSIVLAHVRKCTNGCCCHGCDSIPDPHPFWRLKNDRYWTFAHNGSVNKEALYEMIGEEYLAQNPPNGSGIPDCDPSDTSLVTDSELYFLYLLKVVEEYQWDVGLGLRTALVDLFYRGAGGAMNFVLSDATDVWAFRKGNTLFSLHDSLSGYSAVASQIPSPQVGGWQTVPEYQLLHLRRGEEPITTDLRAFLPPMVVCPNDTSIFFAPPREACLTGFDFNDPDGNIVSVTVEPGWIADKRICFHPEDGPNTIILTVSDSYENVASCSTLVYAIQAEPGAIAGVVVDTAASPLAGVSVTIEELFITASTDSLGRFTLPYIIPGEYDIAFSLSRYMDTIAVAVPVVPSDTTRLAITLRSGCTYIAGDANGSGDFNGLDVTYGVNYFKGQGAPPPDTCDCPTWGLLYAAADANGNCNFNGIDITYCVNYLKGIGRPPTSCRECPPNGR